MAADPARPDPWPTLGKLFLALLAAGVLVAGLMMPAVLGGGLIGKHYASQFENTTCNLQETKPPEPTTLYAKDGKTVIARLFTQDRDPVTLKEVPKYLQDALIATEDRRFYSHHGVDLRGLIRSAVRTSGGDTQGGSTLTMQYVKQIRFYQAGDNLKKQEAAIAVTPQRKMEDARCALDIEGSRHESKGTILDNYLNIAFFGEHAYGIEKAAQTYFGVPSSKLDLPQSALLVGMLRAPSAYDPFVNPEAAKSRRNDVLQNLVGDGKLSQTVANKYKASPISLATTKPKPVEQGCADANDVPNAAFFCKYAVEWLEDQNKMSASQLDTGGLSIVTTLDPTLQADTQRRIEKAVPATSPMTAVLPVIEPKTGNILAMAASKHFGSKRGETEQDIFTSDATGGGASTWKLFPMLAALQIGFPSDWQLETVGNRGTYHTRNCATSSVQLRNGDENVSYNDTESMTTAMAKSSNTYFVGLADQGFNCDLAPTLDVMQKLGMKSMNAESTTPNQTWAQIIGSKQRAQQLVLGSVPTNALEITSAYAAVANGGEYNAPSPILSIKDNRGGYVRVRRTKPVRAISQDAAAKAVKILTQESMPGGASASRFDSWYGQGGSDIAGKTGTVAPNDKNNSTIWFAGMSPKMVATSGIVDFDNPYAPSEGLPGEGKGKAYGDYAAKLWLKVLGPSLQNHWDWDTVDALQVDGDSVPDVTGDDVAHARRTLKRAGYQTQVLSTQCASDVTTYSIAFYGPHTATRGTTITLCESTGVGQKLPPPPSPPKQKPGDRHGHGGSGSGSGSNTGSGGSGSGHGGGNSSGAGGGNGHRGGPAR